MNPFACSVIRVLHQVLLYNAGQEIPDKAKLKHTLGVSSIDLRAALTWLCANHPDYKCIRINEEALEEYPRELDVPDTILASIVVTHKEEGKANVNDAESTYVPSTLAYESDDDPEEKEFDAIP